jgi:hypothetical protein
LNSLCFHLDCIQFDHPLHSPPSFVDVCVCAQQCICACLHAFVARACAPHRLGEFDEGADRPWASVDETLLDSPAHRALAREAAAASVVLAHNKCSANNDGAGGSGRDERWGASDSKGDAESCALPFKPAVRRSLNALSASSVESSRAGIFCTHTHTHTHTQTHTHTHTHTHTYTPLPRIFHWHCPNAMYRHNSCDWPFRQLQ